MKLNLNRLNYFKKEYLVILLGLIISIFTSINHLSKYDKIYEPIEGPKYHQMIKNDVYTVWTTADEIRKDLNNGNDFFQSLPEFKREFLPSVIVGLYYHILDKEIFDLTNGEKNIKENNLKLGILLIQTILYFLSVYFLFYTIQNNFIKKKEYEIPLFIIILFLSLEPTINQFNSSFTSESFFMSMIIILFSLLLKKNNNYIIFVFSGILVGLIFAQRPVSIFFFIPVSIFYLIVYKNKLQNLLLFLLGFSIIIGSIGTINYKKSNHFYIISMLHQYYSYYFYFAHVIYAEKYNLEESDAKIILNKKEQEWRNINNIKIDDINVPIENYDRKDLKKIINYRNIEFINLVISNPIISAKIFIKKSLVGVLFAPNLIKNSYYFDKTSPEAKNNRKEYYNKNLKFYLAYSTIFYFFIITGLIIYFKRIYLNKKLTLFDKFLFFNICSVIYFVLMSGFWGNPKYFLPCILNLSFFFSDGLSFFIKKYIFK